MPFELPPSHHRATGLVDVLDRVLDKGLVIAGDIKVSLAEVELLTIRIRLLVCSLDKAQEIGLDWWRYDRDLSSGAERSAIADREALRAPAQHAAGKIGDFLEARLLKHQRCLSRAPAGAADRYDRFVLFQL